VAGVFGGGCEGCPGVDGDGTPVAGGWPGLTLNPQ
jgi:hypothetical protein